jgi:hypothetical protein
MTPSARTIELPPAGVMSLITALGILEDHQGRFDVSLYLGLANRLNAAFSAAEWERMDDDDRRLVEVSMAEADLVLQALALTETLSVEFEWYPAVIDSVRFIGDALTELWTDDEWLAWHDGRSEGAPAG